MKLRCYMNEEGNKVYTLKSEVNGIPTKEAHYKFLQIRSVKDNL